MEDCKCNWFTNILRGIVSGMTFGVVMCKCKYCNRL